MYLHLCWGSDEVVSALVQLGHTYRIKSVKDYARSLKGHLDGILAHCKYKISRSFLEVMNNKIKVIKRIAFRYRDFNYFFLKIRGAFL